MSHANQVTSSSKRRWLIALVGPAVVAGFVVWNRHQSTRETLSKLPAVDVSNLEPSLAEVLTQGVERVREKPLEGSAWGHYGTVLLANDYVSESAACFLLAERFEPENVRWAYLQGISLSRIDPAKAIPCYRRAIELRSDLVLAMVKLAELLVAQGHVEEANGYLRRAERLSPQDPAVLTALARSALTLGDLDRALKSATLACEVAPQLRVVHQTMAQVQQRLGNAEAVEEELRILDSMPATDGETDDPFLKEVARFRRGVNWTRAVADTLILNRRFDEAIQLLEKAGGRESSDVLVVILLGKALLRSGQTEQAAEVLDIAVKRDRNQAPVHFELGNLALVRRQWTQAIGHYNDAIQLRPNFAVAHYNLGLCQRQVGDRDEAIVSFEQACQFMPENLPARRDLAELLFEADRSDEARYHLKAAVRLAPNDPTVLRLLETAGTEDIK